MLLLALLAAWILASLLGGRLSNLKRLDFRGIKMVPVLLAFNIALLVITSWWALPRESLLGASLHIGSYIGLLWLCIINIRLPGMFLLAIGILLNAVVISLNGGAMPVDPSLLPVSKQDALLGQFATHTVITAKTNASVLGDWIYLRIPYLGNYLISIGDIVMDMGAFILVYQGMKRKRKESWDNI